MYKIKKGETITDVCLNSTGKLSNWKSILDLNNLSSWTPLLSVNQEFEILKDIDVNTLYTLTKKPICNNITDDIYLQLTALTDILEVAPNVLSNKVIITTKAIYNYYVVKKGESIYDVCLNSTGNINNLQDILELNSINQWTPELVVEQKIMIPITIKTQDNVLDYLIKKPICNTNISDFNEQIKNITFTNGRQFVYENNNYIELENNNLFYLEQ